MKCVNCGDSENLLAMMEKTIPVPFAARGGSIKATGCGVSPSTLKAEWDSYPSGKEKVIRGPVLCASCDTEHIYVVGLNPPFYAFDHATALSLPFDKLKDILTGQMSLDDLRERLGTDEDDDGDDAFDDDEDDDE